MLDKKNKGAQYLEFHLEKGDVDNKDDIARIIKDVSDLKLNIVSVHVPIFREYEMEGLVKHEISREITHICDLANKFGEIQGNMVNDIGFYSKQIESYEHILHLIENKLLDGHAQPFKTKEDIEMLERWLRDIIAREYKGIVVLEINEDDYLNSVNFENTFKLVDNILEKLEQEKMEGVKDERSIEKSL